MAGLLQLAGSATGARYEVVDNVKVEVRGIRELSTAFRKLDGELPRALKSRFLKVAENVTDEAKSRTPKVSGAAQSSIKPKGSARGAAISFGGTKAEYFPWLNFGGRVGRNKSIERDRMTPDRYIYTSIADKKEETEAAVDDAIRDTARDAGFETKEGF